MERRSGKSAIAFPLAASASTESMRMTVFQTYGSRFRQTLIEHTVHDAATLPASESRQTCMSASMYFRHDIFLISTIRWVDVGSHCDENTRIRDDAIGASR